MTKFRIVNKEENANEVILRLVDEGEEVRCDWILSIDKASGRINSMSQAFGTFSD